MSKVVVVAAVALLSFPARADKKVPSKAVTDATAWMTAMITPKAAAPSVSAEAALAFETASPKPACDKLRAGKATNAEEMAKVRACFAASFADLKLKPTAKPAEIEEKPIKDASFGQQKLLKTLKSVPADATIVEAEWTKKTKSFSINAVVDTTGRVHVAWMTWRDEGIGD